MAKKKSDPFEELVLDEEEQQLEEALERGEYEVGSDSAETRKMFEKDTIFPIKLC